MAKMNKAIGGTLQNMASRRKKFSSDNRGVAAIEFALCAPLLIFLWLGFAEAASTQTVSTKVSRAASKVSDIISQSSSMSGEQIDAAMKAGETILGSDLSDDLKMIVVGVTILKNGSTRVEWSRGRNTTSLPEVGASYPLPPEIAVADTEDRFVVAANAKMEYEPNVGGAIMGTYNMDFEYYFSPRIGNAADCSNCNQ